MMAIFGNWDSEFHLRYLRVVFEIEKIASE
jgi:hypothetical protein